MKNAACSRRLDRRRRAHQRAGFTAVEIAVTCALVVILAGISIPAYLKMRTDAQITEAKAQLEIIAAAVKQLAWDTGKWPGGIRREVQGNPEVWDLTVAQAGLLKNDPARFPNWQGAYIDEIPRDPWGSRYFFDPDYTIKGKMRPVVGSFGPNRSGPNRYDYDNVYIVLD